MYASIGLHLRVHWNLDNPEISLSGRKRPGTEFHNITVFVLDNLEILSGTKVSGLMRFHCNSVYILYIGFRALKDDYMAMMTRLATCVIYFVALWFEINRQEEWQSMVVYIPFQVFKAVSSIATIHTRNWLIHEVRDWLWSFFYCVLFFYYYTLSYILQL